MTNSACVDRRLEERCRSKPGREFHEHVRMDSGRTEAAQECPPALCRAICKEIQEKIDFDRRCKFFIGSIDLDCMTTSKQLLHAQRELQKQCRTVEEEEEHMMEAYDVASGAPLVPRQAKQARSEEIECVRGIHLYDEVPHHCAQEGNRQERNHSEVHTHQPTKETQQTQITDQDSQHGRSIHVNETICLLHSTV